MIALLLAAAFAPEVVEVDDIPESPEPCAVVWESDEYPDFVEITDPRIHQRCRDLVDTLGFEGDPESIAIEVSGEFLKFQVRVSVAEGEAVLYAGEQTEVCECGANELTTLAMKEVVAALKALEETAENEESGDSSEAGTQSAVDEKPDPQTKVPKHALRWVGVGVGVAGLGVGITGGGLMPREKTERRFDGERVGTELVRKHPLPLTATLVGVGAAGVVAGVAMIVIDAKRSRDPKRTSFSPTFGTQHVGFSLTGKF
ncbi:MAG: hypothetical protein ACRBN8_43205 [Nannocystales bacterium]